LVLCFTTFEQLVDLILGLETPTQVSSEAMRPVYMTVLRK